MVGKVNGVLKGSPRERGMVSSWKEELEEQAAVLESSFVCREVRARKDRIRRGFTSLVESSAEARSASNLITPATTQNFEEMKVCCLVQPFCWSKHGDPENDLALTASLGLECIVEI